MKRGDLILAPGNYLEESDLCLILEMGINKVRVWNINNGAMEAYRRAWVDKNCEIMNEIPKR